MKYFFCVIIIFSLCGMEKPPEKKGEQDIAKKLLKEKEVSKQLKEEMGDKEEKRARRDLIAFQKFHPQRTVSVKEIKKKFPQLFTGIPESMYQHVADYVEFKFGKAIEKQLQGLKNIKKSKAIAKDPDISLRTFLWQAIGINYGLLAYYLTCQSYFHFLDPGEKKFFKGHRIHHHIEDVAVFDQKGEQQTAPRKEMAEKLVQKYKIHLMPKAEDMTPIIIQLLESVKNDLELAQLIHSFKARPDPNTLLQGRIVSRIVIYPASGKENAQKLLDKLYSLLKNVEGSGQHPFANARVSDLIWIAHGDSGDKPFFRHYYEQPNMVYFRPDMTGTIENYHLINPETRKEIV